MSTLWQATLRISRPGGSKTDEEMSYDLLAREHMGKDAARVVKSLWGKNLAEYASAEAKARKTYRRLTFEAIGDIRVVVEGERQSFLEAMDVHAGRVNALADAFCEKYDLILEQRRLDLNGNFKPEDYPTRHSIREKFDFRYGVLPMPEPNQFIKDALTDDLGTRLAAEYEQRLANVTDQVRKSVLNTLISLVHDTAESLAGDGPIIDSENKKGPFAKLQEYLDRVPALNVTNDPQINAIYQSCRNHLMSSSDRLRASKVSRELASAHAANIALKFGFAGRKLDLKPKPAPAPEPEMAAAA